MENKDSDGYQYKKDYFEYSKTILDYAKYIEKIRLKLQDVLTKYPDLIKCINNGNFIEGDGIRPVIIPLNKAKQLDYSVLNTFMRQLTDTLKEHFRGNNPYKILQLITADKKPFKFANSKIYKDYWNMIPLLCKISHKMFYKDFIVSQFEEELGIRRHGNKVQKDESKVNYFTLNYPVNPVYQRKAENCNFIIGSNLATMDPRDGKFMLFTYFLENVEEAMTISKWSTGIECNVFLEFLGDGVLSMMVAWDLVMNQSTEDSIDGQRISKTSSKTLFETCVEESLYEYIMKPTHKLLEFFIMPFIKYNPYLNLKHFEKTEKLKILNERFVEKSNKFDQENPAPDENEDSSSDMDDFFEDYTKQDNNSKADGDEDDFFKEELFSHEEEEKRKDEKFVNEILNPLIEDSKKTTMVSMPMDYIKYYTDLLTQEGLYNNETPVSSEKRKEIQKYFKTSQFDQVKHADLPIVLKAFIGAVYNSTGIEGTSKILKKFHLIDENVVFMNDKIKSNDSICDKYNYICKRFKEISIPEKPD